MAKPIHEYGYKPLDWRPSGPPPPPYLGVELELDWSERPAVPAAVVAAEFRPADRWIAKVDGSVHGPEMVSRPWTLPAWRRHAAELAHACQVACDAGYASHDTGRAGLHVGIGRSYRRQLVLDADGIARLVALVHGNPERMLALSRRTEEAADGWAALRPTKEIRSLVTPSGRYVAINPHPGYLEFRLPRGTLRPATIMATLEWAASMARWAAASDLTIAPTDVAADVGPEAWRLWTEHVREAGDYAALVAYARERRVRLCA